MSPDSAEKKGAGAPEADAVVSQEAKPGSAESAPEAVAEAPEDAVEAEEAAAADAELDELSATQVRCDEYLALAQRTQADFENYRKRMSREVGMAEARGVAKLARELLPALDNLGRALAAAQPAAEDGDGDHLAAGIVLVQAELMAALGRLGIQPVSPLGEPFDPQEHEAMAQQPVEGAASGTVAEVYQAGYRLGETIIRPARVLVAA